MILRKVNKSSEGSSESIMNLNELSEYLIEWIVQAGDDC